tara:strand:+ start:636 stop:938 length:303 start_codon:yes stop_codon:yes gene_type:complete
MNGKNMQKIGSGLNELVEKVRESVEIRIQDTLEEAKYLTHNIKKKINYFGKDADLLLEEFSENRNLKGLAHLYHGLRHSLGEAYKPSQYNWKNKQYNSSK